MPGKLLFSAAIYFAMTSATAHCSDPPSAAAMPLSVELHALGYVEGKYLVCSPCECHLQEDKNGSHSKVVDAKEGPPKERCHELVEQFVVPVYPPLAKTARIEGVVFVQAEVDSEGNVIDADAIEGHPMLVRAAKDAVLKWKFKPSARAVKMVDIRFELTNDPDLNPPRVQVNPPDELHLVVVVPKVGVHYSISRDQMSLAAD